MESGEVRSREVWWNDDRKSRLKELWGKYTNTQIGGILGCTRNSVSGMAFRLGIKKKPAIPPPKKKRVRRKLTEKEKVLRRKPKLMEDIIKGDDIPPLLDSILGLTSENCAYPYGVMAFKFCGRPRSRGAFCEAHGNLCYQAPKPRKFERSFFRIRQS